MSREQLSTKLLTSSATTLNVRTYVLYKYMYLFITYHIYKINIVPKFSAYKHMPGGGCIREFSGVVLVQRNLWKTELFL